MNSSKKKIISNFIFLSTSQALGWILTSFTVVIIPRYLGPSNLGIFSWITAIGSIVAVLANMGTTTFILREFARDPQRAQTLVGPAIILNVVAGLAIWLVGAIIVHQLDHDSTVLAIFYLAGAASIIFLSASPLRAALQGMDKMQFSLFETLIYKGFGVVLTLIVIVLNLGLITLTATNVICSFLLILVYWWWYLKYSKTNFRSGFQNYKSLVRGGVSFLLIDISYNIYLYLDALLLASLTNTKVVGYYSVPTRLFGSLLTAPVLVGQAILPTLARLTKNDRDNATKLSRNSLTFLVCLSLPMAVGCSVMAEPFINFFYTAEYAPSVPILIILGWTALPMYLGIGLYQILTSQDKQSGWSKLMVMAVIVNFILNIVGINYFQTTADNGGIGAAFALLITEIIIDFFGIQLVNREIVNSQLLINFFKSLIAALVMGLVIWPLRDMWLFIPVIIGSLVYGIIIIFAFNLTGTIRYYFSQLRAQFGKSKIRLSTRQAFETVDSSDRDVPV